MISSSELLDPLKAEWDEEPFVRSLERAAVAAVEEHTGRYFGLRKEIVEIRQSVGGTIYLTGDPIDGVIAVERWSGTAWEAVGADEFAVDGGALRLVGNRRFSRDGRYRLTYEAGQDPDPADEDVWDAPEDVKQAVRLLVGHWFENREGVGVATTSIEIQLGVNWLLRAHTRVAV